MLTSPRLPEVKLRKDEKYGGRFVIVDLPQNHEEGHRYDLLRLRVVKGSPHGEFGMTTPGRWYIISRLSGWAPTGKGREGYPSLEAARLHIQQWLANPDNGETWS